MSSHGKTHRPTPPVDQRYLPRWEVCNRVICSLEEKEKIFQAETKDLSCAGACIATPEPIGLDQRLRLTIYLTKNQSVTVSGSVIWVKLMQDNHFVGIQFYNTSEEDQSVILEHAFELNRDELVKHWFKGWEGTT